MEKFINAGWLEFCYTFQGCHDEVSMLFVQKFDGFKTNVGNVLIYATEHSIGAACHLPVAGERWWKKNQLPVGSCN